MDWMLKNLVVAPFLISQCYNEFHNLNFPNLVVAPFLISQCYNANHPPHTQQ